MGSPVGRSTMSILRLSRGSAASPAPNPDRLGGGQLEHPGLSDINQIAEAVESPDLICEDAVGSHRPVYFWVYQTHPQGWIKVVVEHEVVITAHRVRRLKKGETIRWQR